jgi:flagellar basal-body rod protein FlgC
MSSISTIALSGMNAAARRLQVSASNIANATSTGGGTQTSVTAVTPSTITVSDPQSPLANQNGLVAAPNVGLTLALVSQVIALDSYAANATVMKVDDSMSKMLFNITA